VVELRSPNVGKGNIQGSSKVLLVSLVKMVINSGTVALYTINVSAFVTAIVL
jgi:hypothetical protein